MTTPIREDARSVSLDSLALLLAALRNDQTSFELMASTYGDPADQRDLLLATIANVVCVLHVASNVSGIDVEKLLATAAQNVRDLP